MELAIALIGFALASYSVVGNDVIQTLGTFLTSNEKRPWWVLWLFAGGIMATILIIGYLGVGDFLGGNDVAYDRLDKIIVSLKEDGFKINEDGSLQIKGSTERVEEKIQMISDYLSSKGVQVNDTAKIDDEGNIWLVPRSNTDDQAVKTHLDDLQYEMGRVTKKGNIKLTFWYVLPPLILLFITRFGIPISTTFLILSFFSPKNLPGMLIKSLTGYGVAFMFALIMYILLSKALEKVFMQKEMGSDDSLWANRNFWVALQWVSTGFLWSQWLTQDLANIYVYLGNPESISPGMFALTLVILLGLLAFIFYQKGGAIQGIVKSKTNTADIRSATFIDFFYGICLYLFKYNALGLWEGKLPMSTTWVFLGLLAGREIAMRFRLGPKPDKGLTTMVFADLGKAALGLIVSVVLVILLYTVEGRDLTVLYQ
ncbi:MAG: hypothetical protein MRZ79_26490 [Bacteroidia bacterium]|nr:hypothetical protein [Bacteroidia bacterium]